MHFCLRPGCRRSWHAPCLAKANWLIQSVQDLPQRMESLDGTYASSDTSGASPKKKARLTEPNELTNLYAQIPTELLVVARQPISRGGALGVVGNVCSVFRARTMVQNALRSVEEIPDNWEEKLGHVYDVSGIGPVAQTKGKRPALAFQCPQCGEPI